MSVKLVPAEPFTDRGGTERVRPPWWECSDCGKMWEDGVRPQHTVDCRQVKYVG